ncbi:MAG: hypothetical protein JWN88_96 [Frankiales bacterium]|jgi:hypothetical protein|nr:hypothetical protein [Frankiales bacterium]
MTFPAAQHLREVRVQDPVAQSPPHHAVLGVA